MQSIRLVMLCLFSEWTDNFPYDFRDERMSKCLKDMTQLLVNIYPELRRDVGVLMHNLFSKVSSVMHASPSALHIVMLIVYCLSMGHVSGTRGVYSC